MTQRMFESADVRDDETASKDLYEPTGPRLAQYRILESVSRELSDEWLQNLQGRVQQGLLLFPELNATTVTVARHPETDYGFAKADWSNDIIFLPTDQECPYFTVCHELAHLAIKKRNDRGEDVPHTSEEFCSILATARMDPSRIDRSHISYLGRPSVPKEEWSEICRRALEYREERRNYIQKCKEWLQI